MHQVLVADTQDSEPSPSLFDHQFWDILLAIHCKGNLVHISACELLQKLNAWRIQRGAVLPQPLPP